MPHRIFNRTLLIVVAISCAGMLLLYLLSGDEGVIYFFAECVVLLLITLVGYVLILLVGRILLAPLFGLIKDRYD